MTPKRIFSASLILLAGLSITLVACSEKNDTGTSTTKISSSQVSKQAVKKVSAKQQMLNKVEQTYKHAYLFNYESDEESLFHNAAFLINPDTRKAAFLFTNTHKIIEMTYETNIKPEGTSTGGWNRLTYNGTSYVWQDQFDNDDNSIFMSLEHDDTGSDFQTAYKKTISDAVNFAFDKE